MARSVPSGVGSADPAVSLPPVLPRLAAHPADTTAASPAAGDAFRSSGQSPGGLQTVHLVGPGAVGRAFLRELAALPVRLVAVTDRTATAFAKAGLDGAALAAHKAAGLPLATWPGAEVLPTPLAIALCGADVVVDATPSDAADTAQAVERVRTALRSGAFVALAGKHALAAAAAEWLVGAKRGRVGVQAALGGTGQSLVGELDALRADCHAVCLCANATSTVVLQVLERGGALAEGLAAARARGLLEADPSADLDGSDAAQKLVAVCGAVFGAPWLRPPEPAAVARADLRALDPELLRERARRGLTTRLLARGDRQGNLRVAFEAVSVGSPFAVPGDRVVYGYELPSGLRVHTGLGLGPRPTALGLLADVAAVVGAEVRR